MRGLGRLLRNIWYLTGPYLRSEEKWSAFGLLALVLGADFLLVRIALVINLNSGAWVNALQQYDQAAFMRLMISYDPNPEGPFGIIPGFVPIIAAQILVLVNGRYLRQWLQIRWRRWLTSYYQQRWLSDQAYYRLQLQPETLGNDNPDQRISDDIREFVESGLQLSLSFLTNIFSLGSFLLLLWSLSFPVTIFGYAIPAYLVWVALLYSIVGTVLAQLVGRPLVSLNFIRQRVEADYRFALVRLRENAEGVALYSGDKDEGQILRSRFGAIVANWRAIMSRNRYVNAFSFLYDGVGGIFPYFAAAPLYFAKQITFGTLTRVAGAFAEVQGSASWIVNNYMALAEWTATVERLATFGRALDAMHAEVGRGPVVQSVAGAAFGVRDLRLNLPNGQTLLDGLSLRLAPGESLAITGPSGTGKSTLFRALAGIWPFSSGVVERPAAARTLFLPQQPYIPLGTLRRAVAYPAAVDAYPQAAVAAALADVGLGALVPELDVDLAWGQRLSGGEQQRLAVARALLTRPDFLFLDEATANLDAAGEAAIYRVLRERMPGTAVLSIVHSPAVAAAHDTQIALHRVDAAVLAEPVAAK